MGLLCIVFVEEIGRKTVTPKLMVFEFFVVVVKFETSISIFCQNDSFNIYFLCFSGGTTVL